ncbi:hypothetical protein BSKO_10842 [Bryopsis sp. KO-2023]|nr:hypothetical protein BSKO_10842 [Bryopsis sp. KO-2023]
MHAAAMAHALALQPPVPNRGFADVSAVFSVDEGKEEEQENKQEGRTSRSQGMVDQEEMEVRVQLDLKVPPVQMVPLASLAFLEPMVFQAPLEHLASESLVLPEHLEPQELAFLEHLASLELLAEEHLAPPVGKPHGVPPIVHGVPHIFTHAGAPGILATATTSGSSFAQTGFGSTLTTGDTTTFTTKQNGFALGNVNSGASAIGVGPTQGGVTSGTFAQFVGTGVSTAKGASDAAFIGNGNVIGAATTTDTSFANSGVAVNSINAAAKAQGTKGAGSTISFKSFAQDP